MEPHSSAMRTSLFPAYSANAQENKDEQKDNQDWLCNSSYVPTNFQDIFVNKDGVQSDESDVKIIKVEKKRKHSRKEKKKHKKEKTSPEGLCHVPVSEPIQDELSKKTFIDETSLPFEKAFRLDRRSNPENIYYEALEQKHIAKYYLHPKTAFGCNAQEKLLLFPPPLTTTKTKTIRYFSKKGLKSISKTNPDEHLNASFELASGVILEFIPLVSKPKPTRTVQTESKPEFVGASQSWRPPSSQNTDSNQDKIQIETDDSELRNKTISFNKQLTDSPHDIPLWVDFVEFQEELYTSKESKGFSETQLIEKKIAILDKALKHNPKSVRLSIAKLNLCRSVWKIEKVIKGWDDLIFFNPNDSQVWKEYVNFILTDLTYFNVNRVLKVFSKCLRTLSNLSEGIIQSHAAPENIMYSMLDIFSQLCTILKSCGYTEKAIAAYQALIEFNLFSPLSTQPLSVSDKIACFEPFWDSGAARFGEDGAIGWNATVSENKILFNKIVSQTDLSHTEDNILYQKLPEWKTWLEFERLREQHHWLPWKPNPEYDQTDDDIDDIDRTVSFDDISKFLFCVSDEEHKFMLLHHFIKFLNFTPHQFGCNFFTHDSSSTSTTINNFGLILKSINHSLFNSQESSPLCFQRLDWTEEQVDFLKNVFSQSVDRFSLNFKVLISHLWLKFLQETKHERSKENLKKFAKNLLKENRNCLLLWHEYIKIELMSGSKAKAKKTFETLVASSSVAIASKTMEVKELWYFIRSYLDLCIGMQDSNSAVNYELSSTSEILWLLIQVGCCEKYVPYTNEQITPTLILKAVSGFKSLLNREVCTLGNDDSEFCYCLCPYTYSILDCAKCFVYLQYFAQGLDSAIQSLQDMNNLFERPLPVRLKKCTLEELCVFKAELLSFHTRTSTYSMKPLLTYLYDAIKQYPTNPRLLLILVKWRSASSVVSPTRRFFAQILKENYKTQPITWVFAIASELAIYHFLVEQRSLSTQMQFPDIIPPCMGIKWKIRSFYERALNSAHCGYIPILWRSYIKFEMLNDEAEKAESIFHRALQNCGWAKDLIMDGIEYFPGNLKQTIDYMLEKQIRVHTPLEEISLLMEHGIEEVK